MNKNKIAFIALTKLVKQTLALTAQCQLEDLIREKDRDTILENCQTTMAIMQDALDLNTEEIQEILEQERSDLFDREMGNQEMGEA